MLKILLLTSVLQSSITAFEYKGSAHGSPVSMYPAYESIVSGKNPALLSKSKTPFIYVSAEQPWSMVELGFGTVSAAWTFNVIAVGSSWYNFSSSEYRENAVDFIFSITPWKWLSIGAVFHYYNLYIDDGVRTMNHYFDCSLSIVFHPLKWISFGGAIENIVSFAGINKDILQSNYYFSIVIKPVKGITLFWNGQGTEYGFKNSLMVSFELLPFLLIKGGYNFDAETMFGGLELIWKHIHIAYTCNYHTYLGATHNFSLSLSLKERTLKSVKWIYKKIPEKKININSCSYKDLLSIPGLSETMSRRIILYRKKIGPVTKRSFYEIGMESKDIRIIQKYIYGLKKYKKKKKKWKQKYKKKHLFTYKNKKKLFQLLLKIGVNPLRAVKISHARYKRNYKEINRLLKTLKNNKIRKKARSLCGM